MADTFTPELTFGPWGVGIETNSHGEQYRTIQGNQFGPELVVNPTFVDASGWTAQAGWVNGGGLATATATTTFDYQTPSTIQIGHTYRVTFTVVSVTAGLVRGYIGTTPTYTALQNTPGTYIEDIVPVAAGEFGLLGVSGFSGAVSFFSVVEKLF